MMAYQAGRKRGSGRIFSGFSTILINSSLRLLSSALPPSLPAVLLPLLFTEVSDSLTHAHGGGGWEESRDEREGSKVILQIETVTFIP